MKRQTLLPLALSVLAAIFLIHQLLAPSSVGAHSDRQETSLRIADRSGDGIWQSPEASDPAAKTTDQNESRMARGSYRMIRLNQDVLEQALRKAPREFTAEARNASLVITLPMPDGTFARFSVLESPIMQPELAAKFPEIKTYVGQGIDDPTATTRFDWMPSGLHAIILSAEGTIYVDPQTPGDKVNYKSYNKRDYVRAGAISQCLVDESSASATSRITTTSSIRPSVVPGNGTTLRIYRLALAATGEYTQAAGGTKAQAMQTMTVTLNRVNGIFERDLAIRMVLANNNDRIIYLPGQPQPYTNSDPNAQLNENQANLDKDEVIGRNNYDLGHVFSTGSGGVGGLRVVCRDGEKAKGSSGSSSPSGDSFDVDLVSQEIAHQYGANHTFNGTAGSCSGANREASAAYEPGSGSTVLAYANICGDQNLQTKTDDYLHIKSIEEILAYVTANGGCAAMNPTNNNPPTVNAGQNYTIPKGTPFVLTATANDPDPGDNARLTYAWEEYDLGPASPPDNDSDGQARPLFRSYLPSKNPSRTFPRLDYILQPQTTYNCGFGSNCLTGETLPSIGRTMNFQVTARDNRAGGGGVASAQMALTVDGNSGPFIVTAPAAGAAFLPGSPQTVAWNVANTNAAPINAANVKITLSTDGGTTFPTVLADNVQNSGSATVTLPAATIAKARIKVEAAGNIFFNISPEFSVRPPCVAIAVTPDALPDAPQFQAYNQMITASGGTGALTVAVTAGSLPNGLQLANGAIAGPPQDIGTFNFTLTATDTTGCTASKAYTLKVVTGAGIGDAGAGAPAPGAPGVHAAATRTMTFPVTLTSPSDQTVTIKFATKDGTAIEGKNYEAASGTLTFPPGVTTQFITITVMSTSEGDDEDEFEVELLDAVNAIIEDGEAKGDIIESEPSGCSNITVIPGTLPGGKVGTAYNQLISASGSSVPFTKFVLDGGALPPGLSLNETTGALAGTPMAAGTFSFEVAAIDANKCFGSHTFTVSIENVSPLVTAPPVARDVAIITGKNTPVAGRFLASSPSGGPLTFQVIALKDADVGVVTITNPTTGDFSYTPEKDFVGTFVFLYKATDGQQESNIAVVTVTVQPTARPAITGITIGGKNLLVSGVNFDAGAIIVINGIGQSTKHDAQNPTGLLIGKKLVKFLTPGQSSRIQVRNSDGTLSAEFPFTRPAG